MVTSGWVIFSDTAHLCNQAGKKPGKIALRCLQGFYGELISKPSRRSRRAITGKLILSEATGQALESRGDC